MDTVLVLAMVLLGVIVMGAIMAFPLGFLSMLAMGVLHSLWPAIPAFGFWVMVLFSGVFYMIASAFRSGSSVKTEN
jgi:hypothetical protein